MKNEIQRNIVCAIMVFLFSSCGKNNSLTDKNTPTISTEANTAPSSTMASPMSSIKIKGFYIGMSGADAISLINTKYSDTIRPRYALKIARFPTSHSESRKEELRKYFLFDADFTDDTTNTEQTVFEKYGECPRVAESYNSEGRFVEYFVIYNQCIISKGKLIGTSAIKLDEHGNVNEINLDPDFVDKEFMASNMDASEFVQQFINSYNIPEMRVSDDRKSWKFTNPEGVMIQIDTHKRIIISKVASSDERKRAFD